MRARYSPRAIAIAASPACRHAFVRTLFTSARAQAARPEAAHAPLAGLAVSVKDLFDIAGQPTAAGSVALAEEDRREYITEVFVQPDSPPIGRTFAEAGLTLSRGIRVLELIRDENSLPLKNPDPRLSAGDRLVLATGSRPFVPPVPGHDAAYDVVVGVKQDAHRAKWAAIEAGWAKEEDARQAREAQAHCPALALCLPRHFAFRQWRSAQRWHGDGKDTHNRQRSGRLRSS